MTLKASIIFPRFAAEFRAGVTREINAAFKRSIKGIVTQVRNRVRGSVESLLKSSDIYREFFGGRLQGELGVPDPSVIDAVINQWAQGIQVQYNAVAGKFGSLSIRMIQTDYSDVLTIPEATFFYVSAKGSGSIDWLRWLLLEGPGAIIRDYSFSSGPYPQSRTGLGIMVKRPGDAWQVPLEFAGTASDNFVLRALQTIDKEIDNIVRQEITKGIK